MSDAGAEPLTVTLTIVNRRGLHARASAKFVKTIETFDAEITVERDGQSVGGTSIMGLLMLGAGKGTQIVVSARGPEADAAIAAVTALVENGFGEDGPGAA
ncbi:HPr family phosphocarrier protein [Amorphus coralli]|uniref:HPr family phosphocarrier protein n=1 Tax=Amorphus coralli TaxID=340680 RepID=UPI00036A978D|nr:HPr family phosphocarrier protein [Amorphus coralli]